MKRTRTFMSSAALGVTVLAAHVAAPAQATAEPPKLEGRIIFTRIGGEFGNESYFIVNEDGSDEEPLVDYESCCPWAARDGSRLAILGVASDGRESVAIVDLDDGSTVTLEPPGETLRMFPGPFSPDGSQMAYNAGDLTDPSRNGIYIGSADDPSDAVQILSSETEPGIIAMDYSPDGTQLVLYRQAPGDDSNTHGSLAIVNVDGTDLHTLTPDDVDLPCCARWSPDGGTILFADLEGRMLTIHPDGSGLTEVLSQEGSFVGHPIWSPDGSRIIFALNPSANPNSTAPNGLYIVNADGTGLTPFITTPDHKDARWWVPDITAGDS
jgi:Tol biopolymer transport system component